MLIFSNYQVLAPENWQDFENLCCDLWREIWKDTNTQKNGRSGQNQNGVDISGRPNKKAKWAGVQCKGKNNYTNNILTEKEIFGEIEKAKKFEPKLSEFIIATSGEKDAKIEKIARKITNEHQKKSLFSVHIWGWEDIKNQLDFFPEVKKIHFPNLCGNDEIENEYNFQIDYSRELLNNYKPKAALRYLENLKNRIWPNASKKIKFRILTNLGAATYRLTENQKAADLFIEAFQYNRDDEKALSNMSLAHLLQNRKNEARQYAEKVIEKNPANTSAYLILIESIEETEDISEVLKKIPQHYQKSSDVALTIAKYYGNKNDLNNEKKWIEIVLHSDEEKSPEVEAVLGMAIIEIHKLDENISMGLQPNKSQEEEIKKALDLLSSAWNKIKDTEIKDIKHIWLVYKAIAERMLGDFASALKNIDEAIGIDYGNSFYLKMKAMFLCDMEDYSSAIPLLENVLTKKEIPEAPLLYARALFNTKDRGKILKAILVLSDILKTEIPTEISNECIGLLIHSYTVLHDFEKADRILNEILLKEPDNLLFKIQNARNLRLSGDSINAISYLNKVKTQLFSSTSFRILLESADEFFFLNQFEDSMKFYEKIVDPNQNNDLINKLLISYYKSGELNKALQICQKLRQLYGPIKSITEMEIVINEEGSNNLKEAKRICEEYLKLFPTDEILRLRLASIYFRLSLINELDEYLRSEIKTENFTFENCFVLANLFATRSLLSEAFNLVYETRRRFFNQGDVHLGYINFFFKNEYVFRNELNIESIKENTAVLLQDKSNQKNWYVIEDRIDAKKELNELNLLDPLTQELIGKKTGDEIVICENELSTEKENIVEIKSKYVFALHKSLEQITRLFPNLKGLKKIHIKKPEKEGEIPEGFQSVLDEVSQLNDFFKKIENEYKMGNLTIGAFANLLNRNVIDIWSGIIIKPDLGVQCSIGTEQEKQYAISVLRPKPKLIIDLIALLTIKTLNIEDTLTKVFGKLGIAQSTRDLIQNKKVEFQGFESRGFMTIGKNGEEFVRQEISPENMKSNIAFLDSLMELIDKHCDVLPCNRAIEINKTRKNQFDALMGASFIDTILIASDAGNVLFSDDERLRVIAKNEFQVDGVWTQIILMHLANENNIERSKFNEITIKLASLNYYFIFIDASILIDAAKQSNWLYTFPFLKVINLLRGKISNDNAALNVGFNFIYELWNLPLSIRQKANLIYHLLEILSLERNRRGILKQINKFIINKYKLLHFDQTELLQIIQSWEKIHIL